MNWKTNLAATAAALGILGATAYAQPFAQRVHDEQGMMGGYGAGPGWGMMGRPGSGRYGDGMGPGMMGGWGGHMGSGWGGHMGPGMMGGWGGHMGPGMMGGLRGLNLTNSQNEQVRKIEDETRRKNWELMGRMQDEMARQRDLWDGSKVDRAAVLASSKRMFELRQKMLENRLDAYEKVQGLLTPQQREQLDKWSRSWRGDGN